MFRNHQLKIGYVLAIASISLAVWAYAIMAPTHAAYRTQTGVTQTARVASFHVTTETPVLLSEDSTLDCNLPDDEVAYSIKIRNGSEVDVAYYVTVSGFGPNITCRMENDSGDLSANGDEATLVIRFSVIDTQNKTQPVHLNQITVQVNAEQKGGQS